MFGWERCLPENGAFGHDGGGDCCTIRKVPTKQSGNGKQGSREERATGCECFIASVAFDFDRESGVGRGSFFFLRAF